MARRDWSSGGVAKNWIADIEPVPAGNDPEIAMEREVANLIRRDRRHILKLQREAKDKLFAGYPDSVPKASRPGGVLEMWAAGRDVVLALDAKPKRRKT